MFGSYRLPAKIEEEVNITVEEEGEGFSYRRDLEGEVKEKFLLTQGNKLLLTPVEPVNYPREISSFLDIEFQKPVVIEPQVERKVYVKFPVEIGVFLSGGSRVDLLDVFALSKHKFTLYGDVSTGKVCKYWKSEVYPTIPECERLKEGVLELIIENTSREWVEVGKVVLNAYNMKLYYDDYLVAMRGKMRVIDEKSAETTLQDSPLRKGMNKSREIYVTRKLNMVLDKVLMEEGI